MLGYYPQVMLAGSRINHGMATDMAEKMVKQIPGADLEGAMCEYGILLVAWNAPPRADALIGAWRL